MRAAGGYDTPSGSYNAGVSFPQVVLLPVPKPRVVAAATRAHCSLKR